MKPPGPKRDETTEALEAALVDLEEHKRKNANLETKLQQVQKQLEEETGKNRDLQQKLGEQSFVWNRRLGQEEGAVHELRNTLAEEPAAAERRPLAARERHMQEDRGMNLGQEGGTGSSKGPSSKCGKGGDFGKKGNGKTNHGKGGTGK